MTVNLDVRPAVEVVADELWRRVEEAHSRAAILRGNERAWRAWYESPASDGYRAGLAEQVRRTCRLRTQLRELAPTIEAESRSITRRSLVVRPPGFLALAALALTVATPLWILSFVDVRDSLAWWWGQLWSNVLLFPVMLVWGGVVAGVTVGPILWLAIMSQWSPVVSLGKRSRLWAAREERRLTGRTRAITPDRWWRPNTWPAHGDWWRYAHRVADRAEANLLLQAKDAGATWPSYFPLGDLDTVAWNSWWPDPADLAPKSETRMRLARMAASVTI